MPKKSNKPELVACAEVSLPVELQIHAAFEAASIFPPNAPSWEVEPARIGVLTSKFWGDRVRDLTIGFMEQTTVAMRDKILFYANKWGEFSKARFRWTQTNPIIRISFGPGGYYSYLGTDCLSIPSNQHTMNLEDFTVNTPDSEWMRVVVHEVGHSLGCPHEQQRKDILALLDEAKTIAYFRRTQGWSAQEVRDQILVPLEERSLMNASPQADQQSIMCYQFPGSITKSGKPIPGGDKLSQTDKEYFAKTYPPDQVTPPPVVAGVDIAVLVALDATGREVARFKK